MKGLYKDALDHCELSGLETSHRKYDYDILVKALKQSAQVEGLRRALDSISSDKCQEAALVAQSALHAFKDGKEG